MVEVDVAANVSPDELEALELMGVQLFVRRRDEIEDSGGIGIIFSFEEGRRSSSSRGGGLKRRWNVGLRQLG